MSLTLAQVLSEIALEERFAAPEPNAENMALSEKVREGNITILIRIVLWWVDVEIRKTNDYKWETHLKN